MNKISMFPILDQIDVVDLHDVDITAVWKLYIIGHQNFEYRFLLLVQPW